MGEWRRTTWGNVITLQRGFDITKNSQALNGVIPVVSSGGVSSYHDKAMSQGPGVIMGRKGTLGRVHYIEGPYWPHDTTLWVCNFKGNDPRFVYYALKGIDPVFLNVGSASPTLNRNHIHPLPVWWPSSTIQRAVAEVLGALDDKIAANDRALSVGDSLVRADFARLSGEPITLENLVTSVREQIDPKSRPEATPYVGLEHVPRRRMWLQEFGTANMVSSAKSSFQEGDVLFGKLRPYFHKVVQAAFSGIASTDILVLRAKRPELAGLALAAASSDGAVAAATGTADGTRMPRANWSVLKEVRVPWPGDAEAVRFSRRVDSIARLAAGLTAETRALGSTRDELLPLLMSGRLHVKDAEKVVAEVV